MIDWVIDAVTEAGATDITVVANPHHADVAAHLDGRVQIVYQREPRGTANAVQHVPEAQLTKGEVLVVNGDSPLLTADTVRRVLQAHRDAAGPATLASVEDFDGEKLVQALKLITNDNQAAEYYLTDVFQYVHPVTIVRLADPNEAMGIKDRVRLAVATGVMRRRILDLLMLGGVTIVDPASTFIEAGVTIGEDTIIEPFTVIKGATVIGHECRIGPHVHIEDAKIGDRSDCGPFAKLRAGTEVADDVHIGSFVELVRTKVGSHSRVPHVSYLGDTDLGQDANIGAGTITANFDGTNKNRTEIGDEAFIGVDTMLVAPVRVGRGARTGAGSVVTKDVPDGATAVGVPARVVRKKPVDEDAK
jgi:bifunctional UDP-N-acetylglucosamine pyrophosphorylase/glucosamine-1-phosphate N-acetyltransferase